MIEPACQYQVLEALRDFGGATTKDVAVELYGEDPAWGLVERTRQQLLKLEKKGKIERIPNTSGITIWRCKA